MPVLGDRGCPARHRLILPLRCPRGGLPQPRRLGGRWRHPAGGLPSLPPAAHAFSFDSAPYPPSPLPRRGRGRFLVFLCKGLRPLHPRGWMGRGTGSTCVSATRRGAEPQRHWLDLPRGRGPSQTPKFLSPGPPSPWLPALPIERRFYRFCTELATPKTSPPPVPDWQVEQVPQAIQCRGAGGEAPGEINFWSPPSPPGKGAGGIGGGK